MKGDADGKVWLEPTIEIVYLNGFTKAEEKLIEEIIELHNKDFKNKME